MLDPTIRVALHASRVVSRRLGRQYYQYGVWKAVVMAEHRRVFSARSLAPPALVGSLTALAAAAPFSRAARLLLAAEVGIYLLAAVGFASAAVRRRHEPLKLVPRIVAVYPTLHVAYGVGMAAGAARLRRLRRSKRTVAAGDAA